MRRFCVLVSLMIWQGGFMFYGAVVVPIGTQTLGSHEMQGFITRSVTNYLNLAGLIALVIGAWDLACTGDTSKWRCRVRWILWLLLCMSLCLLAWLHQRLDAQLNLQEMSILDRPNFRYLHSWYLIISTCQWTATLTLLPFTLSAWRVEDHGKSL